MKRVSIYDKIKRIFPVTIMALVLSLMMLSSCKKDEPNDATNGKTTAVFNPNVNYGSMTDQDGNVYKTVVIGTQTWMAESLRTTRYRDGTAIPNVKDEKDWLALTTGGYCNNNNTNDNDTIATYGRLYNWYAIADSRMIAPMGWHVPTDAEWTTMTTYLGGESVAGGKMKETGTTHWETPNTGATNQSGFTALPSGYRDGYYLIGKNSFYKVGYSCDWWSITTYGGPYALQRSLYFGVGSCFRSDNYWQAGLAVRLVKD